MMSTADPAKILPALADRAMPIDQLTAHPGNARTRDKRARAELRASLAGNGQYRAVIARRLDDGTVQLLAGHGTWREARELGWRTLAVDVHDGVDDDAARRIVAVDNRTSDLAGYDEQLLADLLAPLPDLSGTGYDDADLAALVERLNDGPRGGRTDPDREPPVPAVPVSRLGDVWTLGPHRLVIGDCTDPTIVARLMGDERADLVLTDPPYCSGGFQESGKAGGSIGTRRVEDSKRITPTIANDTLSTRGYQALMSGALNLAPADLAYVFTDWRMWTTLFDVVEGRGFGVRSMIVWDKGTPGMGRVWRSQHELVMWAMRAKIEADNRKAYGNVISAKRSGNPLHPTQKPVDVILDLLRPLEGAGVRVVYDPFAGAGTVLIACELANLSARLVELTPKFADVTVRRWAEFTGGTPVRNGQPVQLPELGAA